MQKRKGKAPVAVEIKIIKQSWSNCRVGTKWQVASATAKKLIAEGKAVEVK